MKSVSILGCGWTGKALKDSLECQGYEVSCLSRDTKANEEAYMYECDTLVVAIPPRDNYLEVLEETLKKVNEKTQVIMLSSISFYDGKALVVEAEALVKKIHPDVIVLRLGGLMGYDRIAGKYTAGKILTHDSRTNYIHRDDVLGIMESVIMQNICSEIYDVVAPLQTNKKKIFSKNAKCFGFNKTEFLSIDVKGKVFSPTKLVDMLGYTFKKENVEKFW